MKVKILYIVMLSFVLMYIIIEFVIPVKFSIKNEDIDKGKTYIVVEFVGATEEYWKVIDYSDDLKNFINKNPIILTRTMLSDTDLEDFDQGYNVLSYNKFVCYGKYTDLDADLDIINKESSGNPAPHFINYELKDWDIMYPIRRAYGFSPKSYLCNADFNGFF